MVYHIIIHIISRSHQQSTSLPPPSSSSRSPASHNIYFHAKMFPILSPSSTTLFYTREMKYDSFMKSMKKLCVIESFHFENGGWVRLVVMIPLISINSSVELLSGVICQDSNSSTIILIDNNNNDAMISLLYSKYPPNHCDCHHRRSHSLNVFFSTNNLIYQIPTLILYSFFPFTPYRCILRWTKNHKSMCDLTSERTTFDYNFLSWKSNNNKYEEHNIKLGKCIKLEGGSDTVLQLEIHFDFMFSPFRSSSLP